ncbi:hypothetical protein AAHA92_32344 [Salvia divinorum]|uniref:Uncharacterized protein n=1 Tax=Salvia divinorum TaxID=28513 RepID=A0ABD1FKG6_SALDI
MYKVFNLSALELSQFWTYKLTSTQPFGLLPISAVELPGNILLFSNTEYHEIQSDAAGKYLDELKMGLTCSLVSKFHNCMELVNILTR